MRGMSEKRGLTTSSPQKNKRWVKNMPIYKEPLEVQCSQCGKKFLIKFVPARKAYSKKNNWGYWTEKEENAKKEICDKCLLEFYRYNKIEFRKLLSEQKKRLFRVYVANKKIY